MSEEVKPYHADGDGLFGKAGEQVIAPLERRQAEMLAFFFFGRKNLMEGGSDAAQCRLRYSPAPAWARK